MIGPYREHSPVIAPSAFIHDTSEIYGDVTIEAGSAIFSFCSLRGDINKIFIGRSVNVQEHSILHVSDGHPCTLRDWVTVGHRATLHGATAEKGSLIGIGAVVLDGAVVGEEAWVAAGAVVTPGTRIPPRTIAAGTPAKVLRELTGAEVEETYRRARRYIETLAPWYKSLQGKGARA